MHITTLYECGLKHKYLEHRKVAQDGQQIVNENGAQRSQMISMQVADVFFIVDQLPQLADVSVFPRSSFSIKQGTLLFPF